MTDLLDQIAAVVGPKGLLTGEDVTMRAADWMGLTTCQAKAVVRPANTGELSEVMKLCHAAGQTVVAAGGMTGLVHGTDCTPADIQISLERMRAVVAIDPVGRTMTVEAGIPVQAAQEAAEAAGLRFAVDWGGRGTATIGGGISTNAGGINVLKYGNARALTLGLEVVLPDGSVLDALTTLHKDNTGYDLKQLFIGSEGTLGLITAASLKLFPAFKARATAFAGLASLEAAVTVLSRLRAATAEQLVSFELLPRFGLDLAQKNFNLRQPLDDAPEWVLLIEAATPSADFDISLALERALGEALETGEIVDALMAETESQRQALWALREGIVNAQPKEGASIKHDIAVPVASIPAFVTETAAALAKAYPTARLLCFGHVGDGNLHFNLLQPEGGDPAAFLASSPAINRLVHDHVAAHKGSISAEHGIGQLRRDELSRLKSPVALGMMRAVKAALDPDGRFNPGKVL